MGLTLKCLNLRNNYTEVRRIMEWLLSTCFFSRATFFYGVVPVSKMCWFKAFQINNTCGPLWMKYNFRGISAWIRMGSPMELVRSQSLQQRFIWKIILEPRNKQHICPKEGYVAIKRYLTWNEWYYLWDDTYKGHLPIHENNFRDVLIIKTFTLDLEWVTSAVRQYLPRRAMLWTGGVTAMTWMTWWSR